MKLKSNFIAAAMILGWMSNGAVAAPHWTHEEQADWGAIEDPTQTTAPLMYPYAECSIGTHQSPVDLGGQSNARKLNTLQVKYTKDKPDFYNSGHAVQVNSSANYKGELKIGNDLYPLIQYHFHAPSEHVINGTTYPAELHFVHIREDGRIAVLGVLLEEGAANETLQTILDNVKPTASEHNANTGIEINPKSLLPHDVSHFYTYAGSLTTPPCSEGVSWYVLAKPVAVSTAQLSQLESLYSDNARHAQALNGRVVTGKVKN
ncbi:carbonic anhydrase [Methylomicrobium sp. RS1]|jgi:carbonic anhydrase|uniref:carbonic anhydrase n=1 Tax=Candidatus Methylomicrobium oryzae TaxID=2802053 RepID=UPI001921B018|nr:carbonic anhydrase family protein [Methylomicrobium sp. RS1]MBL1265073.1 carbonic anhydrase family protein [Methylomicrobium sp. RS1]